MQAYLTLVGATPSADSLDRLQAIADWLGHIAEEECSLVEGAGAIAELALRIVENEG